MAVGMATACEVSVLAQRLGLDPQVYFNIVTRSSGDSWVFRNWFPLPGVVETSRSSHGYEAGFMIDDLIHRTRAWARPQQKSSMAGWTPPPPRPSCSPTRQRAGAGALDCTAPAVTLGADVEKATVSV